MWDLEHVITGYVIMNTGLFVINNPSIVCPLRVTVAGVGWLLLFCPFAKVPLPCFVHSLKLDRRTFTVRKVILFQVVQ